MSEDKPVWLDQRDLLKTYRHFYRIRSGMDDMDSAGIDGQLSALREQMTDQTRKAASQYERAWRKAA